MNIKNTVCAITTSFFRLDMSIAHSLTSPTSPLGTWYYTPYLGTTFPKTNQIDNWEIYIQKYIYEKETHVHTRTRVMSPATPFLYNNNGKLKAKKNEKHEKSAEGRATRREKFLKKCAESILHTHVYKLILEVP